MLPNILPGDNIRIDAIQTYASEVLKIFNLYEEELLKKNDKKSNNIEFEKEKEMFLKLKEIVSNLQESPNSEKYKNAIKIFDAVQQEVIQNRDDHKKAYKNFINKMSKHKEFGKSKEDEIEPWLKSEWDKSNKKTLKHNGDKDKNSPGTRLRR